MNGEKGKSDGNECFTLTLMVEVGHFLCGQFWRVGVWGGAKLSKMRLWK